MNAMSPKILKDKFSKVKSIKMRYRLRRVAEGMCSICGKLVDPRTKWFCSIHRAQHNASRKRSINT